MIKRILVALSGTKYTPTAVHYALEISQSIGATVTGVTAVDIDRLDDVGPVPVGAGAVAEDLQEHRHTVTQERIVEAIESFQKSCQAHGVKGQLRHEQGNCYDEFTALARYHDLSILGLRGFFEYNIVTQPDDAILELIGCGVRPLLAVPEQPRQVRNVLLAYNGSQESAKAMRCLMQMNIWPNAVIHVATFGLESDESQELLDDAAAYCKAYGHEAQIHERPGPAAEGILAAVEELGADAIAMGSTGRSALVALVAGDSALHVIKNSEVPVFLTR